MHFSKTHIVTLIILQGRRKGGTLGASAPPMFGRTVNPISTRGADYALHSTTSPPNFQTLRRPCFDLTKKLI